MSLRYYDLHLRYVYMNGFKMMTVAWLLLLIGADQSWAQDIKVTSTQMTLPSPMAEFDASLQVAKWKDGYLMSYPDGVFKTRLLFTKDFRSFSVIKEYKDEIIWDIETTGGQVAVLSSPVIFKDQTHRTPDLYAKFLSSDGSVSRSTKVIGAKDMSQPSATQLDNIGSRYIRWEKGAYVLYFTISKNLAKTAGTYNVHQAQCQIYMDKSGRLLNKSVGWGVSHSFEQRIDVADGYTLKVAKGDAYPRGIDVDIQSHELEVSSDGTEYDAVRLYTGEPMPMTGDDNYVDLVLGDVYVMAAKESAHISGISWYERDSPDIFFIDQSFNGDLAPKTVWLTSTPDVTEHSVRMLPYTDGNYLMIWKEYKDGVVDEDIYDEFDDRLYSASAAQSVGIYYELNKLQTTKAAVLAPSGKFLTKPQKIDADVHTITKDMDADIDYMYDIIDESYGIFFTDAIIEPDRIVVPFFVPRGSSITFYVFER